MRDNPIAPTIDLDADGVQHGFLRLPYSRDNLAWGSVMIPISVGKRGKGPTALLTGANHGDEYEGPIALQNLAAELDDAEINGRVIIVPFMNYPAFKAGTRTSPIDRGNLNRVFPGRPDGSVTEKIADYFQRVLLPQSDVVLDFHSGGRTLDFLPFACIHRLPDADLEARARAAMLAFGAPYSMVLREIDAVGMYDTAAEEMGKVFVSTELGGGGTASARTAAIAINGCRDFLRHSGILKGKVEQRPSVLLDMPSGDCFVFSEGAGLVEYRADLGDHVEQGAVLARIWPDDRTGGKPRLYHARMSGLLVGRHFPGLIKPGDCLAVLGVEVGRQSSDVTKMSRNE